MKKNYTTFEEIDEDLKILYLQSEIDKEELKLSVHDIKDSVTPSNVLTGVIGGLATSAVLVRLLTPVASFAVGKLIKKYLKD